MNFITNTIMLNLFLLVTLQQYEDFHSKESNPIEKFNGILTSFKKAFIPISTEKDKGHRIKNHLITQFLCNFDLYINRSQEIRDPDIIKKYIMDLALLK